MFYAYILKLSNGQYYTGFSEDLKARMKKHKKNAVRTTARLHLIELVFYAAFKEKKKALTFERYLKSSSGFAFRNKKLI